MISELYYVSLKRWWVFEKSDLIGPSYIWKLTLYPKLFLLKRKRRFEIISLYPNYYVISEVISLHEKKIFYQDLFSHTSWQPSNRPCYHHKFVSWSVFQMGVRPALANAYLFFSIFCRLLPTRLQLLLFNPQLDVLIVDYWTYRNFSQWARAVIFPASNSPKEAFCEPKWHPLDFPALCNISENYFSSAIWCFQ